MIIGKVKNMIKLEEFILNILIVLGIVVIFSQNSVIGIGVLLITVSNRIMMIMSVTVLSEMFKTIAEEIVKLKDGKEHD